MSHEPSKPVVLSFKADAALQKSLSTLPNRSEFIRSAILNALDNTCPLCLGTGLLQQSQKTHWESFMKSHHLESCNDCESIHLVCDHNEAH
jgi:hypothetical protein